MAKSNDLCRIKLLDESLGYNRRINYTPKKSQQFRNTIRKKQGEYYEKTP